jgi:hypothetical protein
MIEIITVVLSTAIWVVMIMVIVVVVVVLQGKRCCHLL